MISKEFMNWLTGIRPQPAQKHRTAKPGTLGSLTTAQFKALVSGAFAKAMPGATIPGRPRIQFKDFRQTEYQQALSALIRMTADERKGLLAQADKLQKLADDVGLPLNDLIEILKTQA